MTKEALWSKQNAALRHPSEIFGTSFEQAGITANTLKYKASASFTALLHRLGITLIVGREYENMLIALSSSDGTKLRQSFFHLPHPSGIAVDHKNNSMYVAATRNPNQIIEFRLTKNHLDRLKFSGKPEQNLLMPARSKYYPGEYYFHDLALSKNKLYANSVGMNCIIEVDMDSPTPEKPLWWPTCVDKNGTPDTRANYIQLNSIAIGESLSKSYFSASGAKISARRPGHANYPVDKQGVIFSGKTGEVVATGLTRPHSARLHNGKVWVANSGYGEVGYIENGKLVPAFRFDGWTRGLCFVGNILFAGVSRVLPRFRQYAPGIKSLKQTCAVVAIDTEKGNVIGEIQFPYGNQLFAMDYMLSANCSGFPFISLKDNDIDKKNFSISLV
ncbi:MAG: TIGR03032 family protein [Taibaiella sp.]|nr:TIGR03032 family protein [Taibaiella sp.]